jgi:hypothetical protein
MKTNIPQLLQIAAVAVVAAGASGGGFSPEAEALFAAMTVQPDNARKIIINDMIVALIAAGVWDKLDLFYTMAAHDEQAGRLNWVSPGNDTLATGPGNVAPTFTVDMGYSGVGHPAPTGAGFTTGRAETALTKALQNDAHMMTRSLVNQGTNIYSALLYGQLNKFDLCPRTNGVFNFPRWYGFSSSGGAIATDFGNNTFCVGTVASNTAWISINGAAKVLVISPGSAGNQAKSGHIIRMGHPQAEHGGGGGPWDLAFASVGASLSDAETLSFYNATQAYLAAI